LTFVSWVGCNGPFSCLVSNIQVVFSSHCLCRCWCRIFQSLYV